MVSESGIWVAVVKTGVGIWVISGVVVWAGNIRVISGNGIKVVVGVTVGVSVGVFVWDCKPGIPVGVWNNPPGVVFISKKGFETA